MLPPAQAHAFEPFFTTKDGSQRKGLGLAVLYGVLKNCGGSIFFSSEPNRGSVFQLILPRIRRGN